MMINLDCLLHGVLQCACGFGWMYDLPSSSLFARVWTTLTVWFSWTLLKREQIRARFAIPGDPLNDYWISYWCQVRLESDLLHYFIVWVITGLLRGSSSSSEPTVIPMCIDIAIF